MAHSDFRIEVKAGCIRLGHKVGEPQQHVWLEVNTTGTGKRPHPLLCTDPIPKLDGYKTRLKGGQRAFEPNDNVMTWLDEHVGTLKWSTSVLSKTELAQRSKGLIAVLEAVASGQIKSYTVIQRDESIGEQVELAPGSAELLELSNKVLGKPAASVVVASSGMDSSEVDRRLSKNLENRARDKRRSGRRSSGNIRPFDKCDEDEDDEEPEGADELETEMTTRPKLARTSRRIGGRYNEIYNIADAEVADETIAVATNEPSKKADDLTNSATNNVSPTVGFSAALQPVVTDPQFPKLMQELNAEEKELNSEEEKWAQLLAQKERLKEQRKRIDEHKRKLMQG